mmetsp:Transcript_18116/g.48741  ORF Transcript_18116/g.48741 Transcript_18116/m.48741 type:complete len:204 (-) Transcript_18116:166-777(-)
MGPPPCRIRLRVDTRADGVAGRCCTKGTDGAAAGTLPRGYGHGGAGELRRPPRRVPAHGTPRPARLLHLARLCPLCGGDWAHLSVHCSLIGVAWSESGCRGARLCSRDRDRVAARVHPLAGCARGGGPGGGPCHGGHGGARGLRAARCLAPPGTNSKPPGRRSPGVRRTPRRRGGRHLDGRGGPGGWPAARRQRRPWLAGATA